MFLLRFLDLDVMTVQAGKQHRGVLHCEDLKEL